MPAWFASTTQLPAALNVTTGPEIEHTDALEASIVTATGLPDPPPAADTEYVPPTTGEAGGVDVKVIAWAAWPTVTVPPA